MPVFRRLFDGAEAGRTPVAALPRALTATAEEQFLASAEEGIATVLRTQSA